MALLIVIILGFVTASLCEDCIMDNVPERIIWEKQLRKDLKCDYRYIYAPPGGSNASDLITAEIDFTMKYFSFNSKEEVFKVDCLMVVSWTDERLKWDPEKYFGIKKTEMPSVNMWTPIVRLFNSADSNDYDMFYYVRCHVNSNGRIFCTPRITHQATCSVKLTNWPYDVQECSLELGPYKSKWSNFKMNFSSRAISMLGAEYGAEWFISDYRQVGNLSSEKQLTMTFVLQREAGGLAAVVVYPAYILTALSVTTLFLDVRLNLRLGVACFSLLCHYYFLSELGQDIPKHSLDSPLILLYYRGSLIVTLLIVMITLLLSTVCKLKSPPQNYIMSINDFVYESHAKYLVFPRWDVIGVDSKMFHEDWTKFCNVVNSVFVFIFILTYIGLYSALVPKPVPVTY